MGKLTISTVGFRQIKIDDPVFYQGESMYILYTDDYILAGPDEEEIRQTIADIKATGLDITEEGDIEDFLVVNIEKVDSDTYHM